MSEKKNIGLFPPRNNPCGPPMIWLYLVCSMKSKTDCGLVCLRARKRSHFFGNQKMRGEMSEMNGAASIFLIENDYSAPTV